MVSTSHYLLSFVCAYLLFILKIYILNKTPVIEQGFFKDYFWDSKYTYFALCRAWLLKGWQVMPNN